MKGSLESDNLMAMLASGMSPLLQGQGRRNSGNSLFDLVEHRSDNEMSIIGQPIDELENSQNQEEEKEDDDEDESKGSIKVIFENPLIVDQMPRCIVHP
jgi:hypothetical protein